MESSIKNYALDTLEAWRNFYKRVMSRAERTGKEGKGLYIPFTLCGFSPASAISPKRLYRRKNFEYCFSELPLTAVISPRKIQETSSGRLSIKISLTMSVIPMRMTIIAQKPSESHDTDFVRESSLKIPTKNRIRKATIAIR